MNFASGSIVGQYRICDLLGSGAGGRVFAVEHLMTGRREALKVMLHGEPDSPEAQRFLREAQLQARLDHPNIVKVHNAFREDSNLVIIMELIEGESLETRLSMGRLTLFEALDFARQALSALDYAHANGVTHRDIKPSNILIAPGGVLKLTDFGLAKTATDVKLTQTGALLGSPYYMSPEQVMTEPVIDARSDIYSLGVVLYEMASGQRPFEDQTPFGLMLSHLERSPQGPPGVPQALGKVILRALAKTPEDRFQTAGAFRHAIDQALAAKSQRIWKRPAVGAAAAAVFLTAVLLSKRPETAQERQEATAPVVQPSVKKRTAAANAALHSIRPASKVSTLDLSPDGRLVATGSESGDVEIWETGTSRRVAALRGHTYSVTAVAFSSDGNIVVTGDTDGNAKLWDLTTRSERGDYGQPGFINHVAISPDGQWLASASAEKRVRVWNLKDANVIHDLRSFKRAPSALGFSPDGATLAVVSADKTLRLWNLSRSQARQRLSSYQGVSATAFSPDGQRIAVAGSGRVRVLDLQHQDQISAIEIPGSRQALAFTPDGRCLTADAIPEAVVVWDVYRGQEISRYELVGRLRALSLSRDGRRIAIAPEVGPIAIRDVK